MLRWFEPMLAANRPARVPPATWALEPKLDGWRALVYIEDGKVEVRTRTCYRLRPPVRPSRQRMEGP